MAAFLYLILSEAKCDRRNCNMKLNTCILQNTNIHAIAIPSKQIYILTQRSIRMYILIYKLIFLQVCLTSPKCFTNYEPRVQSPLSERIVGDAEQWTLDISFLDKAAVSKNQLLNRGAYVLLNIIWLKNRQMSIALFI